MDLEWIHKQLKSNASNLHYNKLIWSSIRNGIAFRLDFWAQNISILSIASSFVFKRKKAVGIYIQFASTGGKMILKIGFCFTLIDNTYTTYTPKCMKAWIISNNGYFESTVTVSRLKVAFCLILICFFFVCCNKFLF